MDVNWDAVGAIGEIAGALAVVVTLVYLSRQIRESTRQLSMASATEVNTLFNEAFAPIYNSEHNMRIWVNGLREPESLTGEELEIFFLFMSRLMGVFDTVVRHNEHLRTLDSESLGNNRDFVLQFLGSPGGKLWSEKNQLQLTSAAREILRSA